MMQRFPFHTQTANKQIKQTMKSRRLPASSHRPPGRRGGLTFAAVWLFGLSSGKNPREDEPSLWLPLHAGSGCCCLLGAGRWGSPGAELRSAGGGSHAQQVPLAPARPVSWQSSTACPYPDPTAGLQRPFPPPSTTPLSCRRAKPRPRSH